MTRSGERPRRFRRLNRHNGLGALYRKSLTELSKVAGKSVEKILLAICKQATEQRQEALEALEQSVPQLVSCPRNSRYIVAIKMGRRQGARREHI